MADIILFELYWLLPRDVVCLFYLSVSLTIFFDISFVYKRVSLFGPTFALFTFLFLYSFLRVQSLFMKSISDNPLGATKCSYLITNINCHSCARSEREEMIHSISYVP